MLVSARKNIYCKLGLRETSRATSSSAARGEECSECELAAEIAWRAAAVPIDVHASELVGLWPHSMIHMVGLLQEGQ